MSQNPITSQEESSVAQSGIGPLVPRGNKRSEVYSYDFDKQGGAVGDIFLLGEPLPEKAVVTNSYLKVDEVPTSGGGATIAVTVESAGDIQAAAAISGSPWSATGTADTTAPEPGTESGYITTTARRKPKITIATASLTAGKFYVVLEYDVTQ